MKSSIEGGRRLLMVVMSDRSALGRCVMSLTDQGINGNVGCIKVGLTVGEWKAWGP